MIFTLAILSASQRGRLAWWRGERRKPDTNDGRKWVYSWWSLPRVLCLAERPAPWPPTKLLNSPRTPRILLYQEQVRLLLGPSLVVQPKNSSHLRRPRIFNCPALRSSDYHGSSWTVLIVHACVYVCVCEILPKDNRQGSFLLFFHTFPQKLVFTLTGA